MGGNRLLSLIVVLLLVGVGAYFLVPAWRDKVDETVKGMTTWTLEERRKNPEGFIKYAQSELAKNIDKFEERRGQLRVAAASLEKQRADNQSKLTFANGQLAEFKTVYKATKANAKWPVTVAGAAYKEPELRNQVALLLSQRTSFEAMAKELDAGLTLAEQRGLELASQISESQAKLGILGAQLELVRLNKLTSETEKLMSDVNEVLLENQALAQKPSVRTVEEMMKDARATTGGSDPSVDAFLND
jgi:hypothetical protein